MKIKQEYVMRQIAGETILVPVGKTTLELNGLLTLNECGRFLWERLEQAETEAELTAALLEEYDVDPETAKQDVSAFLEQLRGLRVI